MGPRWEWTATSPAERADRAILEALEAGEGQWSGAEGSGVDISRSRIQRLMEQARILIDGAPARANQKIRAGTRVRIDFPAPVPLELTPEDRPIDVLFEDRELLVVNKPPGLTVHPSATQREGTLVHALLHHVKDLSGIGGKLRPGIVHRIDKDTSGALVITKTDAAHRGLVEKFARHDMERVYWALVYGSPEKTKGTIESTIGRNPADRKKMAMNVKGGRRAVTHYERLDSYAAESARPFASWLALTLETGRTHQIRVHLTGLGNSILGDPVYGTPSAKQSKWLALPPDVRAAVGKLPGQALHARVLGFEHPITGKTLRFEAEPPAAFRELMRTLERYR